MKPERLHRHPDSPNGEPTLRGAELEVGDTFLAGDVFARADGSWMDVHPNWLGKPLVAVDRVVVRPAAVAPVVPIAAPAPAPPAPAPAEVPKRKLNLSLKPKKAVG